MSEKTCKLDMSELDVARVLVSAKMEELHFKQDRQVDEDDLERRNKFDGS